MGRIDPHSVSIGNAVRAAIAQADLTQAEVAGRTDMAVNTLSRRINGLLPFTWPELNRIAKATGLTIGELVEMAERIARRDVA